MAIALSQFDFDRLVIILSSQEYWRSVQGRLDFMTDVLAGSPRKNDLLGQVSLDGAPHGVAVRVVQKLADFGQDTPGRESLGALINKLIGTLGFGDDADFLHSLFARYSFVTKPVAPEPAASPWQGNDTPAKTAEKIIGENTLRHVRILEMLIAASRAVVKISGPNGLGSGFMAANDLVLTNHHVIGAQRELGECEFIFNYQLDHAGNAAPVTIARAKTDGLFHTSEYDRNAVRPEALDYTVLQLADPPGSVAPLRLKGASVPRDARVAIIQHPDGDYKKISMQNNFVAYSDPLVLQYTTSTLPGSSGSPVFNDDVLVVGLHHAGSERMVEPNTGRHYFRNEGIAMRAILEDLRAHKPDIFRRLTLA